MLLLQKPYYWGTMMLGLVSGDSIMDLGAKELRGDSFKGRQKLGFCRLGLRGLCQGLYRGRGCILRGLIESTLWSKLISWYEPMIIICKRSSFTSVSKKYQQYNNRLSLYISRGWMS